MSRFKDYMIADIDIFLNTDEFAEKVTYSGTGQQITAIVERGETMDQNNTFFTGGFSDRALISVTKSDVRDPQQGETFTDEDGVSWEIAHRMRDDEAMIMLECITNERPILSR